jgi:hypothetical protein
MEYAKATAIAADPNILIQSLIFVFLNLSTIKSSSEACDIAGGRNAMGVVLKKKGSCHLAGAS